MRSEEEIRTLRDKLKNVIDRLDQQVEAIKPKSPQLYSLMKFTQAAMLDGVNATIHTLSWSLGDTDCIAPHSEMSQHEFLKELEEKLSALEAQSTTN